jgi:hypothetical protein
MVMGATASLEINKLKRVWRAFCQTINAHDSAEAFFFANNNKKEVRKKKDLSR